MTYVPNSAGMVAKRAIARAIHGPPQCTSLAAKAMLFIIASSLLQACFAEDVAPYSPAPARRSELISLVRQDCGSCHGLTLKGGLGPALLPETLHDKPLVALKATILQGRPGTPMPPWRQFLSDAEAEWIVVNLQKGFPSVP